MEQECIPIGCLPAARRPYAGVCFRGGVCLVWGGAWSWGGLPGLEWGSAWFRGGCLPGLGGSAWSRGVCLVWGGGCLVLGGLPGPRGALTSQHVPRQTPSPPVDRHTPVKTLPWPQLRCGR